MPSWHALPSPCLWSPQVSTSPAALTCPALSSLCRGAATRRSSLLLVTPDDCSPADPPHGRVGPSQPMRERFVEDLPVLRLHFDRGGEFSSDLLRDFCRGEGILQSFTLPYSPQQNGIAERRIGLVMRLEFRPFDRVSSQRFNPEIDWVNRKMCIYNNGKRVELRSWTDTGSVPETTLARFERTVNESNTGYLALVMAAAEEEVLEQYKDIMPDDLPAGVPPARTYEHEIVEKPGAKPVSRAPYRLSPTELTDMKKQIEYLLDRQLIRPSTSPHGAPVLFTPKPDGSLRMCINYRALNKQTALTTAPVLILPDPNRDYVVEADASDQAVGAVLMQHHERSLQPITYLTKKLLQWEKDLAVLLDTRNLNLSHLPSKLRPCFCGPFLVEAQVTPVTFRLRLPDTWKLHNAFHVQLLKPYKDPNQQFQGRQLPPPPPVLVQDEPEYEVERVLTHRRRGGKTLEFLLRWKGYDPTEDSWFYHATSRRVLPSQDVTFDESVPFYRLFPYRSAPSPPSLLFLAPGPPPVDPLPPQGPAPSGVSQIDPLPGTAPVQVAVVSDASSGAASGGAEPGGCGVWGC
ncbi:unnamed protein product [Closterium sp. NIES-53]